MNEFDCFFQNLNFMASTTPNKHWQNVVEGEGYHSNMKQHNNAQRQKAHVIILFNFPQLSC